MVYKRCIYLSIQTIVHKNGISQVIKIDFDKEELKALQNSIPSLPTLTSESFSIMT
jgi:malate/lactate dehydrogenase